MSDDTHKGHRLRLKRQFLQNGIDSLTTVQVLEMLLFYSVPRVDTNPLAHRLLDHFGGLAEVLDADFAQLRQVEGVSESTATHIVFASQLFRRYQREKVQNITIFNSFEEIQQYLQAQFIGEKVEKLRILCLNNRAELLHCAVISEGTLISTNLDIRSIIETVLRYPTTFVVMAHNHPAGFALPSTEDVDCTIQVGKMLKELNISLIEHLVFSPTDCTSMRQTPRLTKIFAQCLHDEITQDWIKE